MKNILGKTLTKKEAISTDGKEIGKVIDAYFENDGKIESLLVKPDQEIGPIKDYLNDRGLITIPFEDVRAIGEFVVVRFPPK